MHKKRIFKFFRNAVAVALAVSMLSGDIGASLGTVYASENQMVQETEEVVTEEQINKEYSGEDLADNVADGVILHAWNWSFSQIKSELPKIAAAGFTAVQTSPIQPNKDGADVPNTGAWWKFYQPTDFTIGNKLGSEDEFKSLCEEAHKYGIKIVVDVVANHLANNTGGANTYEERSTQIPDYIRNNNEYWHSDNFSGSSDGDRYQMTRGPIGMPDLNTGSTGLQDIIMKFLSKAQADGADGFRFDAAKHIETPSDSGFASQFWARVKETATGNDPDVFLYGEILNTAGPGGYSDIQKYTPYIRVTNNKYGHNVQSAAVNNSADSAKFTNNEIFGSNGNEWVLWNESHDTFAGEYGDQTRGYSEEDMKIAWCAVAARTSTALYFSRPTGGSGWASAPLGSHTDAYTDERIAAVNKFHNAFAGKTEYVTTSENVLVVERGTSGVVLVNFSEGSKSVSVKMNKVADGTYTEQISGQEVTVSGGTLNANIPSGGVAVIYNKEASNTPKITSSVADGETFTDTLDVTISVENATSASYSLNGGSAEVFTTSKTITLGEGDDYGTTYTIAITAENADGETTKTFTYKKTEPKSVKENTVYFTKPSGWGTPCIYTYATNNGTTTEFTGAWASAEQMTDEGDGVYSYTFADSVTTCNVIFKDSSNQIPASEKPGFVYEGGKAYEYVTSWKEVAVSTATPTPTDTPTVTDTPTPTTIQDTPSVEASMKDGESFSTETATVKLTLKNAVKGYYSVDNGPVKEFTDTADVVIGKGKIADSDVTLKVTVEDENGATSDEVFVYRKEYVANVNVPQVNSGAEETVEEAEVNAASNDTLASQYKTNANGVGVKKTISVDGAISDWDSSMLIAQGAANDDPRVYMSVSMHELPVDLYALYGAYDDSNLYLMWEMTNVQDVVAPNENYPLSQGILYLTQELPFHILVDTGKSDTAIGNEGKTSTDGTLWNTGLTTSNSFNRWISFNTKGANGPYVYGGDSSGVDEVEILGPTGTASNISVKYGLGILSKNVIGINGAYGGKNRVVGDLCNESAAWADFNTLNHSSDTMDFHYEVSIPLDELGITASDVESTGVGVLVVSTFGMSAMDSLPYDVTLNDNADQPDTQSQPGNSFEKSDADHFTCTFARIGNGDVPTNTPIPSLRVTTPPTVTEAPTDTPTPIPVDGFHINFGADRSAPQYNTTELTIEAIAAGGVEPCSYEFFVDGNSVQTGESSTYTWKNDTEGAHKIKVVVTDSTGATVTSEKEYDLEADGDATPTPTLTVTPIPTDPVEPTTTVTPTPTPDPNPSVTPELTNTPTPTQGPSLISITKFIVSCKTVDGSCKVGDEIVLRADTANANGTPQYMFTYIVNGEEVIVKNYGPESEVSFTAETVGTYKFKVYVVDNGNEYSPEFETGEVTVVAAATATPTPTQGADATATPAVTVTATPTPTETPLITGVPVPTATATPTPTEVVTATPTPTEVVTATPTPTEVVTATPTPTEVATATPTPTTVVTIAPSQIVTATATPTPTKAVTATATPTPTEGGKATVTPTKSATATPVPTVVVAPEKGMIIVDEETGCDYTVTSTGSSKTVECTEYAETGTTVVIPDVIKIGEDDYKVTTIADNAFKNNKKIKTVTIGKNITKIGKSAFYGCTALQKVKNGTDVKTIGDKAFYGCKKLTSVTLSSKLTTIGNYAFYKCTSLKKITIPSKVSKIGTKAFYGCKKLKTITIKTTKLKSGNVGKQAFKGIYSKATIKVPKSKLNSYKKLLKSKGVSGKAKIKK